MAYCFLSYARSDAGDPYFEKFVKDFLEELRGRIGAHTIDGLAFRDSDSISLGSEWEPSIERALLVCRTFIAMLSPTYLQRAACSKEWACFEWRLRTLGNESSAGLLLPLVWIHIPDEDLPVAVRRRQRSHASLGPVYAARGLRYLVKRDGVEYRDFIDALADLVRDLVRMPPLSSPPAIPDELGDPFAIANPASEVSGESNSGPRRVEFVMVVGRRSELRALRSTVSAYGAEFDEWRPYEPQLETFGGILVQKVAVDEGLTTNCFSIPEDFSSYLQGARARNIIVVLIVDVWSLRLPVYRSYMNLFDRERFVNAAALVVWNLADNETSCHNGDLMRALGMAFPNLTVMTDSLAFHEQLGSPQDLVEKLRATLYALRRRIIDFGAVMRRAEGATSIAKPVLVGPGGV